MVDEVAKREWYSHPCTKELKKNLHRVIQEVKDYWLEEYRPDRDNELMYNEGFLRGQVSSMYEQLNLIEELGKGSEEEQEE